MNIKQLLSGVSATNPLTALGIGVGGQLLGSVLGKQMYRRNKIDENEAYQNAPQYDEFSSMLDQSYQMRGQIEGRVDNYRNSTLAKLLSQLDSTAPMSTNSGRNVAQANAQSNQAMNMIAGVEANANSVRDQYTDQADAMQTQGRSELGRIMQLNSMARQEAMQQANLANRQLRSGALGAGQAIGQTLASGIVNASMFNQQLDEEKNRGFKLEEMLGKYLNEDDSIDLSSVTNDDVAYLRYILEQMNKAGNASANAFSRRK
jgi:hypothetical protein